MSDKYRFERISESNLEDFCNLFELVHKTKFDISLAKAKFDTQYTGACNIGYLAYSSDNQVAAYYGIFPTPLNFKGKKILAAQSGDTMTHPNHRRKGLFNTLFELTKELAVEEEILMIFGFPNHISGPGLLKFGWKELSKMNVFRKEVKIGFLRKIYRRFVNSNLKSNINCLDSMEFESVSSIYYDSEYMNYKRFSEAVFIRLKNGVVWTKKEYKDLVIGIMTLDSNDIFDELELLAKRHSCNSVRFDASPNSNLSKLLDEQDGYSKNEGLSLMIYSLKESMNFENVSFVRADYDTF